jgi:hypothetical protein
MNRLATLAPIALLTAACAAQTPATALDAANATEVTRLIELPPEGRVVDAWHLPHTSPWFRYEKLTLLAYLADVPVDATMPDVGTMDVVTRAKEAARRVALAGVPLDTMWVVDLRGAASVAFGATLSQEAAQPIAPVMTFNNWPAENEVVPAEETLAALVSMRPRPLPRGEIVAAPVFMLDAWRLALRGTTPDPLAIDNRYVVLASDFPDPATLRARGIRRVVYVVEDRRKTSAEEDDFHEVALAYQDAGIPIALVDLQQLASIEGPPNPEALAAYWDAAIDDWEYSVRERVTVFDDVGFYQRARGGFGGVRAAPAGCQDGARRACAGAERTALEGPLGTRAYSGASPHVMGPGGG